MKISFTLLLVLVILVGLGIGAGAAAYNSASQVPAATVASADGMSRLGGSSSTGGQTTQQLGSRPTIGVVDSVGDGQFTLKAESSSTPTTVRLDDRTTIRKQVSGTVSDITPGERLTIQGETGADGAIAATAVQIADASGAGSQAQGGAQGQAQGTRGQFQGSQGQSRNQQGQTGSRTDGGSPQQGGQGAVIGTVASVANNVVSVNRLGGQQGQSAPVRVTISDATVITKTVAGEAKDIAPGASVLVTGPQGTDGAIVASIVQIMPQDASRMRQR
ncbi:MAG: hypothetical protein HYY30_08720 [Chloroflexi bacterium]|nr:hypothetical protein [Chloroflexota bacterium]